MVVEPHSVYQGADWDGKTVTFWVRGRPPGVGDCYDAYLLRAGSDVEDVAVIGDHIRRLQLRKIYDVPMPWR